MPSRNSNKIYGVIGSKGTGKSSFAQFVFRKRERAVVFDTMGEYDYGFCVSERLAFIQYMRQNKAFRICYLPLEPSDFSFVSKAVRLKGMESVSERAGDIRPQTNLLFIVEEVSQYCSAVSTDEEFSKCIQLGRHASLDILYTGQRFADIARRVTSQTDIFYCFRVAEPRDLEAIRDRFGDGVSDVISKLPDLHYVKLVVGKVTQDVHPNVVDTSYRIARRRVLHNGAVAETGTEYRA